MHLCRFELFYDLIPFAAYVVGAGGFCWMIGLEDPFNSSQYTKRHKLVTAYIYLVL